MKKIDTWTVEAIKNNGVGVYSCDNTVVRVAPDGARIVELIGNKIFYINARGNIFFTLAGWNTQTTRARLNAILSEYCMSILNRGGVAYLFYNDELVTPLKDSGWIKVFPPVSTNSTIHVEEVTRFD